MKAQLPSHLWTQTGIKLQVKNCSGGHKGLGCILSVGKAGGATLDTNHHLQAACKAFFANKLSSVTVLCLWKTGWGILMYFDAVVSPVAVFGSRHRTIHQKDLHQLDVACRKFLCAVVGPPSNLDWSRPWQEIFHEWNGKVQSVALEHGMTLWSHRSLTQCWKLPMHFVSLPNDRWSWVESSLYAKTMAGPSGHMREKEMNNNMSKKFPLNAGRSWWSGPNETVMVFSSCHPMSKIFVSTPGERYAAGCPRHNWGTKISAFVRFLQVDDWQRWAHDIPVWLHLSSFNSADVKAYP